MKLRVSAFIYKKANRGELPSLHLSLSLSLSASQVECEAMSSQADIVKKSSLKLKVYRSKNGSGPVGVLQGVRG